MLLKRMLKGSRVLICQVHPESQGYFVPGSVGTIQFIEADGAVWVNFDKWQAGVKDVGHSLYAGNLDDCDELFELLEDGANLLKLACVARYMATGTIHRGVINTIHSSDDNQLEHET